MEKIIPYGSLFLVCLFGVLAYYRWVEPPNSKKENRLEKQVEVSMYVSNEVSYWRWYSPFEGKGMYDFKTYEEAVKSLRMMGYWSE